MTAEPDALRLVPARATRKQLEDAAFNLSVEIGPDEELKLAPHIERAYELLVAAAPAVQPAAGREEIAEAVKRLSETANRDEAKAVTVRTDDLRIVLAALAHPPAQGSESGGVYVASRASVPERGRMWRGLRAKGAPIISTWIDEDGEGQSQDLGDLWDRICREVTGAARLILYVEPGDFPLKGAFIEVGMALAAGVPVFVVAPGVDLEPRSLRPLGSWAKHPLVTFCDTVEAALSPQPGPASEGDGE